MSHHLTGSDSTDMFRFGGRAPTLILELYCRRVCIEILFDTLKNVLGAFCFHFWSLHLPRHSRRPTTNRNLKPPKPEYLQQVQACWRAMEAFVFCTCVAAGLLQLFSLKYHDGVWRRHLLYLRTRSRELPSKTPSARFLPPCWRGHLTDLAKTACGGLSAQCE